MKIRGWMLEAHGYTEGCKGCEYKRAGLEMHRGHNTQCRKRMEEAVELDERGKKLKEIADNKRTQWLADEVERAQQTQDKEEAHGGRNRQWKGEPGRV